ncbi:molybdopterin molybdotransferase [Sphingomonas vulcanisoli]|uniref:Molybdopterin molybdenumtransferase n=1 Tax=Sphingomonas vulcanisoli TaxID=1658060 RepID=A0ABX0TQ59_9SPHN|nr:molybdopterin molybdotransferase MoeA [Sphingomonas vulcanisoli]NIJ07673.1 molybdopterin molybdotransferase [Sphingomonas vulcanisoli]
MAGVMLSVGEAQARLLALAAPLPIETVPLVEAAGRWLAAPIEARRTQPAADLSAMDGYAIRFADLPGPWILVGESAAGRGLDRAIEPGEAARIFTGAPLPQGTDTILIQEEAAREGDRLSFSGTVPPPQGNAVRAAGTDFARGVQLLEAGARLSPAAIALAAMGGHGAVPVRRRPRIAILSTGDELVPPGAPTPGAMLPSSNAPMLASLIAKGPGIALDRGIVPDRIEALEQAFAAAAAEADLIVTTGGVSVGDHDLVRPALERAGASLDFWKVAMRPGKPLMAGRLGDAIVLGLPGNPVAAFVTAHLFLLPLAAHLAGAPSPLPKATTMPVIAPLPAIAERTEYLRARIIDGAAHLLASRDSAALFDLVRADALIVRAPHSPEAFENEIGTVYLLA